MTPEERKKHLRKFGLVMSVPFLVLAGFLFWKGRPAFPYVLAPGALFLLSGLVWPTVLGPVEKGWMWIAMKLQIVMTTVILSLAYFLILTPIALVGRLRGRDALRLRKKDGGTYWVPADREGSAVRPRKPY
jgi:hypothetical protein